MDNQHDKLIQQIDSSRPSLSKEKKEVLWSAIASETINKQPILSPYAWLSTLKKPLMAPAVLALVLMLGTTGLVAASEPTRPGDTLFAVKQATENIRLALASDDAKTRLEAEFAAERLLELSSILEESLAEYRKSTNTSLSASDEKRVNHSLGITLSYLGQSSLPSSTKDNLYAELASILEGAPVRIDNEKIKSYKNDAKVEIREEKEDKRIEIKDGENKLHIREKDGELRIKYEDKWADDKYDDEDKNEVDDKHKRKSEDRDDDEDVGNRNKLNDKNFIEDKDELKIEYKVDDDKSDDDTEYSSGNDNESQNNKDDQGKIRIEVRVENNMAEVRVEGERDDEFTLTYTNRDLLITTIALRTGLSKAIISSNLDLEIKD